MIINDLNIPDVKAEDLKDDDFLFGDGLGLDSLDAVELTYLLKKYYNINLRDRNKARDIFISFKTLANFIRSKQL